MMPAFSDEDLQQADWLRKWLDEHDLLREYCARHGLPYEHDEEEPCT